MKRIRVALNAPRRVHDFVAFARAIAACLSGDPLFSPPPSPLAKLEADVVALEAALAAVLTRRVGAAAERKARQTDVLATLQVLQAYVQTLANTRTPNEAAMVAKRAGMAVKDARGPSRAALMVKPGRASGSAHAFVPAAKTRAGYEWQLARDGGDWVSLPFTVRADVDLDGLDPGTLVWVRARSVSAKGPSNWLTPVRFRVA
jgi:hypothetical protein